MQASDIMSSPVYILSPADTVSYTRNLMMKHKISRCPVLENGSLEGIITKKDLAFGLRQSEPVWRRRPLDRIPVEVLMTRDPITVAPETSTKEIANIMVTHDISGLPVKEEDSIVGIVTKSDLIASKMVKRLKLRVSDLLKPVETVSRYHSLDHVIDIISSQNDKVIVVNNDGTIAGIITESNVALFTYMNEKTELPHKDVQFLRREESGGKKLYRYVMDVSVIAEDIMSRPVISMPSADAPIQEVVSLMREHHINSVIVADGTDLKGIVKRDDIIREVAK